MAITGLDPISGFDRQTESREFWITTTANTKAIARNGKSELKLYCSITRTQLYGIFSTNDGARLSRKGSDA
jgi:hypothetical protein